MNIIIRHNGIDEEVEVPNTCEVGHIRSLEETLEDIGAPSTFTLAINGMGVPDTQTLKEGDVVTFRPKSAEKG